MNAIKSILNVLGILAAIPVALFLALWLVCVPPAASVEDWVQPDTIKQFIRSIDYEAILEDTETEDEFLMQVMKTEAVTGVMDLFVEDLFAQFEGASVGSICTEQAVRDCVEAHMDELISVFRNYMTGEEYVDIEAMTDEELAKHIRDSLYPEIPDLLGNLPKAEDLCAEMGTDLQTAQITVQMLRNGTMTKVVIGLAVVLTLVLFVLRLYRLRGFIWLSVVYFLNAGLALLLGQSVNLAIMEMPAAELAMMKPLMDSMTDKLTTGGIIYAVVAVVCVVAAVLYHNYLVNRSMPRPENVGPELY